MSNISEFRSAISSGLVRQHKWRVIFDWPSGVGTVDASRKATLLAKTASTPSSNLGVIDLSWGGRQVPVPGDRTYDEFSVTFIGVNDHEVRDAFEQWSEAINGSESNTGLTDLDTFTRDITFDKLNATDEVTKTYVLKDAWPVTVSGEDMDSSSTDSHTEFTVTFRYINYETNTTR